MRDELIGYLMKSVDCSTRASVESSLKTDQTLQHELELLKRAIDPLQYDAEDESPADDLSVRTIAFIAEYVVNNTPKQPSLIETSNPHFLSSSATPDRDPIKIPYPSEPFQFGSEISNQSWSRRTVAGWVALALSLAILAFPAIVLVRDSQAVTDCQNQLRSMHLALSGYADLHDGQFPKVKEKQLAGEFVAMLQASGQTDSSLGFTCPGSHQQVALVTNESPRVDYAYTLGYRDELGVLQGIVRNTVEENYPLVADAPDLQPNRCQYPAKHSPNHLKGQNILLVNGQVRFVPTPRVEPDGNVFCNDRQEVRAGLRPADWVLGRKEDRP
jgi:hypothetical protein